MNKFHKLKADQIKNKKKRDPVIENLQEGFRSCIEKVFTIDWKLI